MSSCFNIKRPTWTFWGIGHILGGCWKPEGKSFWGFSENEGSDGKIDTQYFPRDQQVYVLDTKLKPFMAGSMSKRIGRGVISKGHFSSSLGLFPG